MSVMSLSESPRSRISLGPVAVMALLALAAVWVSLAATWDLSYGVLVASTVVGVFVICIHPPAATWICLFLLYINAPAVAVNFHGVHPMVAAMTVGLLLIPIAYYVLWKREPLYVDSVLPWLLAFSAVQFASAILATDTVLGMEALLVFLMEGLAVFLLVSNATRRANVIWALLAAGVLMGGLAVFQKVTATEWNDYQGFAQLTETTWNYYGEADGARWPTGPIGDKNYFAQFMLMLLPFALFLFWNERSRWLRTAGLGSAMIIFAGIGLSGSRGAAIGLVAMVLVMFVLGYAKIRHLVGLAVVITGLLMVMPHYRERVLSIASVATALQGRDIRKADTSVQGRLTEMYAAALVTLENPLFGVGPGNFPAHFVEKAGRLGFAVHGVERRAHCLYLEIAAEMGIPGLACLAVILGLTIRNLFGAHAAARSPRLQGLAAAALLGLFGMMVTGMFLSLAYIRYFWLYVGLCSAISRMAYQEEERFLGGEEPALPQASDPEPLDPLVGAAEPQPV